MYQLYQSSPLIVTQLQGFAMNYLSEPKEGWIIPVSIPVPEDERKALETDARKVLAELAPELELPDVDVASEVKGEWQGISGESVDKELSEKDRFDALSANVKDGPILFCIHGGGYVTGSVAMERTATFRMARTSGARVFAVEYRIAPQHPFPDGLLDAVVAYKYLVHPPPGALHEAIDPARLIVAGDSAGVKPIVHSLLMKQGGLAIALVTMLMKLKTLPLPAGVIGASPWVDFTCSFPSAKLDRQLDWPPCTWGPPHNPKPSPLWPPAKPRFSIYTDLPMHPFVLPTSPPQLRLMIGFASIAR
jgi:acetyl esterase/lipase